MTAINCNAPEGIYVCTTVDITNGMNSKQEKTVLWKLEVAEGEYTGEVFNKWYTLCSEDAKSFLMKELALAQLPVTSGAELTERKSELDGRRIMVEAKLNKDNYMCFYIKGLAPTKEDEKSTPQVNW